MLSRTELKNMAIAETQNKLLEQQKEAEPLYWVVPTYRSWYDEQKYILEFELPGVKKDSIKVKALTDYFSLKAQRDRIGYTLELEFGFNIDPAQIKATYHEGLLRMELPIIDPSQKAIEVKIE